MQRQLISLINCFQQEAEFGLILYIHNQKSLMDCNTRLGKVLPNITEMSYKINKRKSYTRNSFSYGTLLE